MDEGFSFSVAVTPHSKLYKKVCIDQCTTRHNELIDSSFVNDFCFSNYLIMPQGQVPSP